MPPTNFDDTQILSRSCDTTICANPVTLKRGPILIRDLASAIEAAELLRLQMLRSPERALSTVAR